MIKEKRKGELPIPHDVHNYLNDEQRSLLNTIQEFGWSLGFIRRPLFQEPVVVAVNALSQAFGVLESDGHFNTSPDILLRG